MKSTPRVAGGIPLVAIGYKYNSRKVLVFIATQGGGGNEPGDPYLSYFPDIYYNVSVLPVVCPQFIGRYYNSFNTIYYHNSMRKNTFGCS